MSCDCEEFDAEAFWASVERGKAAGGWQKTMAEYAERTAIEWMLGPSISDLASRGSGKTVKWRFFGSVPA